MHIFNLPDVDILAVIGVFVLLISSAPLAERQGSISQHLGISLFVVGILLLVTGVVRTLRSKRGN